MIVYSGLFKSTIVHKFLTELCKTTVKFIILLEVSESGKKLGHYYETFSEFNLWSDFHTMKHEGILCDEAYY